MKIKFIVGSVMLAAISLIGCSTEDTDLIDPLDQAIEDGNIAGDGTPSNPFQLTTAEQVDNLLRSSPTSNFLVINDIDFGPYITQNYGNEGWLPINDFLGVLDGGSFTLSGLYINRPSTDNVGFFGSIGADNNATTIAVTIRNLTIEIAASEGIIGGSRVGGIIGDANDGVSISNVHIRGADASANIVSTAAGSDIDFGRTGGLVGNADRTTIIQCSSTVLVESGMSNRIGGLVGMLNFSTVDQSYASGNITSAAFRVGGLIGFTNGAGTAITNSYATGNINITASDTDDIGGFIGASSSSIAPQINIANCYSTGNLNLAVAGYDPGFAPGNSDSFGYFSGDGDGGTAISGSTAQTITNGANQNLTLDAVDQGSGFTLLNIGSTNCSSDFSSFDPNIWQCVDGSFPILINNQ